MSLIKNVFVPHNIVIEKSSDLVAIRSKDSYRKAMASNYNLSN